MTACTTSQNRKDMRSIEEDREDAARNQLYIHMGTHGCAPHHQPMGVGVCEGAQPRQKTQMVQSGLE